MSADTTEFLADGTEGVVDQVEKVTSMDMGFPDSSEIKPMASFSLEEEKSGVNLFTAETFKQETAQVPGMVQFDAQHYGMGMYELLGRGVLFEDLSVEDMGESGFDGHWLAFNKPPRTFLQATFSDLAN